MNSQLSLFAEICAANERIRPFVRQTYLESSFRYKQLTGGEVHFKLENLQHTGSFKYRGATNRIRAATTAEIARGFVTASTGNHGAAFAKAAHLAETRGIVFVPANTSPAKLENIAQYGINIQTYGDDGVVTETHARQYAAERGMTFVSPYNDLLVAAGQGTIGVELERQMERPADLVFVALGGGGLISGIGCYLKAIWPGVQIIGCSPENSKVMIESIKVGQIQKLPSRPTLSDGTAGGVEPGSITFDWVRDYVDEFITVSEREIGAAIRCYLTHQHQVIEGAAGVAVAALLKYGEKLRGKRAVVVICGGNIAVETLKKIL